MKAKNFIACFCMLLGASMLLGACKTSSQPEEPAEPTEHMHSYTEQTVEPTLELRGHVLHTCECGESYMDTFTGILDPENSSKTYTILFIGNSYTYYNELWHLFQRVAKSQKIKVEVESVYQGGYTLEQMNDPADTFGKQVDAKLKNTQYDIVFLQEQSERPAVDPAPFYKAVRDLGAKITINGAAAVLYQTWGRKTGSQDLIKNNMTNESMTQRLAAAYEAIGKECNMPVSAVGSAFYDVYTNHPEIELYNEDLSHPAVTGSYLAALCHYATVFGKSPVGISYASSITDSNTVRILQEAAHKAVFGDSIVKPEYQTSSEEI